MRTDQPLQEKKCNRPLRVFLLGEIKNFPSRQASPLIQIPHRSPLTDECQTDCQEEYAGQKHDHKIPSNRKSKDAGILREQYDRGEKPDDRPKGKSDAPPQQAVGTRNTPIRLPIKIWSPNRRIEDKGQPPHRTPDKEPGRRPEILWIKGIQHQQESRRDADQDGQLLPVHWSPQRRSELKPKIPGRSVYHGFLRIDCIGQLAAHQATNGISDRSFSIIGESIRQRNASAPQSRQRLS